MIAIGLSSEDAAQAFRDITGLGSSKEADEATLDKMMNYTRNILDGLSEFAKADDGKWKMREATKAAEPESVTASEEKEMF